MKYINIKNFMRQSEEAHSFKSIKKIDNNMKSIIDRIRNYANEQNKRFIYFNEEWNDKK